jgi:hypothetical protein
MPSFLSIPVFVPKIAICFIKRAQSCNKLKKKMQKKFLTRYFLLIIFGFTTKVVITNK